MGAALSKRKEKGFSESGRILNIVILGSGGVGKSALTIQFVQDKFIKDYVGSHVRFFVDISEICRIEDNYRKQISLDGFTCMLNIWDTAGQEEYQQLQDGYIRDADGFILVYSVTDRMSLEKIRVRNTESEPIVIFANKCDLEGHYSVWMTPSESREVTTVEGKILAESLHCSFVEMSAKVKLNVEVGFHTLIRKTRQHLSVPNRS